MNNDPLPSIPQQAHSPELNKALTETEGLSYHRTQLCPSRGQAYSEDWQHNGQDGLAWTVPHTGAQRFWQICDPNEMIRLPDGRYFRPHTRRA